MQIRELLPQLLLDRLPVSLLEIEVNQVTADSREVGPGTLFIAIKGAKSDGHDFVTEVFQKGAVLVLGEKELSQQGYLNVPDSREAFARVAAVFYGHPSRKLVMVGVTGTCGKTTTTHLIESVLKEAKHKVGLIGTNGIRYPGRSVEATHTTPNPLALQKVLRDMRRAGCTAVVMEVSSHALAQHRVTAISWDVVVFTNLTPEHLDYHKNMEDYFAAKSLLFTDHMESSAKSGKKPAAVINRADPYGERLFNLLKPKWKKLFPFSVKSSGLIVDANGIRGQSIHSNLVGEFNAENILAAVHVGNALRLSEEVIARGINNLQSVRGRMERVDLKVKNPPQVIVDYAHKPDALRKVLIELRSIVAEGGRVLTVFGCGGDRDQVKRPVMGKIAEELSDHVYVTSDNPRSEEPEAIIREIVKGMEKSNHSVEPDRKKAIHAALEAAKGQDIVLIAGKGHETGQTIKGKTFPFDDVEVVSRFPQERQ